MATYIVKKGDNLSNIAKKAGIKLKDILSHNDIENPDYIQVGQKINLPTIAPKTLVNNTSKSYKQFLEEQLNPSTKKEETPTWNRITKNTSNNKVTANFKQEKKEVPTWERTTKNKSDDALYANFNKSPKVVQKPIEEKPSLFQNFKNNLKELYGDVKTGLDQQVSTKNVTKPVVKDIDLGLGYKELGTYKDQSWRADKNDSLLSAINIFDNDKGFDYIVAPKLKEGKRTFNNVKGVAQFLMDTDITENQKYTQPYKDSKGQEVKSTVLGKFIPYEGKDPMDYVMYSKKVGQDKDGNEIRNVKYGQIKDKNKFKDYEQIRVRNVAFDDLDFNNKKSAGFAKKASYIGTKDGKQTSIITDPDSNDVYGRFSGGSGTFLFKEPKTGKMISADASGSINTIKNIGETLAKKYNINKKDLQFLYQDMGSYSAKPKSHNGTISNSQWENYNVNNKGYSGAALLYPEKFKIGGEVKEKTDLSETTSNRNVMSFDEFKRIYPNYYVDGYLKTGTSKGGAYYGMDKSKIDVLIDQDEKNGTFFKPYTIENANIDNNQYKLMMESGEQFKTTTPVKEWQKTSISQTNPIPIFEKGGSVEDNNPKNYYYQALRKWKENLPKEYNTEDYYLEDIFQDGLTPTNKDIGTLDNYKQGDKLRKDYIKKEIFLPRNQSGLENRFAYPLYDTSEEFANGGRIQKFAPGGKAMGGITPQNNFLDLKRIDSENMEEAKSSGQGGGGGGFNPLSILTGIIGSIKGAVDQKKLDKRNDMQKEANLRKATLDPYINSKQQFDDPTGLNRSNQKEISSFNQGMTWDNAQGNNTRVNNKFDTWSPEKNGMGQSGSLGEVFNKVGDGISGITNIAGNFMSNPEKEENISEDHPDLMIDPNQANTQANVEAAQGVMPKQLDDELLSPIQSSSWNMKYGGNVNSLEKEIFNDFDKVKANYGKDKEITSSLSTEVNPNFKYYNNSEDFYKAQKNPVDIQPIQPKGFAKLSPDIAGMQNKANKSVLDLPKINTPKATPDITGIASAAFDGVYNLGSTFAKGDTGASAYFQAGNYARETAKKFTKPLEMIPGIGTAIATGINELTGLGAGLAGVANRKDYNAMKDRSDQIDNYKARQAPLVYDPNKSGQYMAKYGNNIKNMEQRVMDDIYTDFDKYLKLTS